MDRLRTAPLVEWYSPDKQDGPRLSQSDWRNVGTAVGSPGGDPIPRQAEGGSYDPPSGSALGPDATLGAWGTIQLIG